jgi:hypothetical protein
MYVRVACPGAREHAASGKPAAEPRHNTDGAKLRAGGS